MSAARWIIVFFLVNLCFIPWAAYNDNAASRLAAMAAISEYHSFRIDPYLRTDSWTKDWARGPDGHQYSNKAPLPILLGEPIFWIADQLFIGKAAPDAEVRDAFRRDRLPLYNWLICVFLQALPFSVVTALALRRLHQRGSSVAAMHWAAAAMLFGNTAAVLTNLYFGHPLAAWCVLAAVLAGERDAWTWAACFLSAAVGSDYGAIVLCPAFLCIALRCARERRLRGCSQLVAGALLPGILVGLYHRACFGRPWSTALQFEAPEFADLTGKTHAYWGIFHAWPNGFALIQLLVGGSRGLLITQPWILLVILTAIYVVSKREQDAEQDLILFTINGFLFLWLANACFGQWHGGWTIGPRYMSCLFPTIGLLGGRLYDRLPALWRKIAWSGLIIALLLAALIVCGIPYVPQDRALWPYLIHYCFDEPLVHTGPRVLLLVVGWSWAGAPLLRRPDESRTPS